MATDPIYIPTKFDGETPYYTQRVTLDGIDYQFRFDWSVRESRWYLALLDTDGSLICGPLKILTNWPMLHFYKTRTNCPQGELIAVTLSADDSPPGLTDLGIGRRVELIYVPAE